MKKIRPDITPIVNSYLCHSCGACYASCGHGSISFTESIGGYYFPIIDYDSCTRCGLCLDVCSGDHLGNTAVNKLTDDPFIGNIKMCKVGVSTKKEIYENSQSGGVVTGLLSYLLDTRAIEVAVVSIMQEKVPPRGDVILAYNSKDLARSQKSKYTPIPLLNILHKLNNVKGPIAIVGLACHMQSLQNYCEVFKKIRKKEIIKIGLICDRVLTTTSIDFISTMATKKSVKHLIFRDKGKASYPGYPLVITTDNHRIKLDKKVRLRMKDYFTPARCRLCFDKMNVLSDIVCGDPHGMNTDNQNNGETLLFVRTNKGKEIINNAETDNALKLRDANVDRAIIGQSIEKKRYDWSAYTLAWEAMGHTSPNYSFKPKLAKIENHKARLVHALNLDRYETKSELIEDAKKFYYKDGVKRKIANYYLKLLKKCNVNK
ncbi:MAG: Coenzyme F420 hydrogenase/dehydrogenase, beta subunit C-terminal domain [Candidatus Thiodiazotropha sp.]